MRGFGTDENGNFGEMVSSLGPLPQAQTVLFNNLAPGLPQRMYLPGGPVAPINPAPLVASGGASRMIGEFAPREQYIEWQGKKLLLGVDVDAKNPWFTYAGVTQPNFLYKTLGGAVRPHPIINGPALEVPSGEPLPVAKPLSPPLVPAAGEVVRTLPLPKETVKPNEAMWTSPPNGNLVAVDSYDLAPAGAASAPVTQKKLPVWAWVGIGYVLLKLARSL